MEGDGEVEMCVISKGPPFLKPVTLTMATVLSAGHEGRLPLKSTIMEKSLE